MQVFDLAFSEAERRELSKLISLASVNLERGQLADCSQLLDGYWPQFLVANVPLTQTPIARASASRRAEPDAGGRQEDPDVLENRLKGYLPRLQR